MTCSGVDTLEEVTFIKEYVSFFLPCNTFGNLFLFEFHRGRGTGLSSLTDHNR